MGDTCGVTEYAVSRWGQLILTEAYRRTKMGVVISIGLKCIWELKMGTPSSARIIEDVDLALKALEIVDRANGAAVERLADRNGHIWKVVGEGESVSMGGARTKGKGRECELTKKMFLRIDMLRLCLKKKYNITEFFPDTTVFYD